MSDPIDYFNPKTVDSNAEKPARVEPITAVPAEFDCQLTTTTDHAAARAIMTALEKLNIDVFQASDGDVARRHLSLHVRESDRVAAAPVAAEIFARRQKVKTLLPKKPTDIEVPFSYGQFG